MTDRLKDVIKSGGEWISSLLIEDTLSQHQAVSEAAVIGVPDETWGERPYAIVTIKEEQRGKVSEEDLKAFLQGFVARDVISKWSIPDRIVVVESIPKTSVGKLDKKEIRKRVKMLGWKLDCRRKVPPLRPGQGPALYVCPDRDSVVAFMRCFASEHIIAKGGIGENNRQDDESSDKQK